MTDRCQQTARHASAAGVLLACLAIMPAAGASNGWLDPCRDADSERSAHIFELYQGRDMETLWVTHRGLTAAGERLRNGLRAAAVDANSGQNAHDLITNCLRRGLDRGNSDTSPGQLDVLLTDAFLALARHHGADADSTARQLLEPVRRAAHERALVAVIDRVTTTDQARDASNDRHAGTPAPTLDALDAAIERYRRIHDAGGWPRLVRGPELEPGVRDDRVHDLRERLHQTGDLASPADEPDVPVISPSLIDAIERFQRRHGLAATGTLDEVTRKAMNVPVATRIEQLRINRQRLRAHDPEDDGLFVRVNIPDFRVELHQQRRILYSTRAVVGRPDRQTPVLEDRITHLTLNPAWNVPQRITREDLAPRFAQDPGYAERHGYELDAADRNLADIDWSDPAYVPLRQRPGPTNALGQVKFEMPNERAIFLHDTPQRHLFRAAQRTFSAGCVRVEDPLELASRLAGYGADGVQHLAGAIRDGETRVLRLGRTVPVQLVYFTAWADERGLVQFRDDVYNKDAQALARLDE